MLKKILQRLNFNFKFFPHSFHSCQNTTKKTFLVKQCLHRQAKGNEQNSRSGVHILGRGENNLTFWGNFGAQTYFCGQISAPNLALELGKNLSGSALPSLAPL